MSRFTHFLEIFLTQRHFFLPKQCFLGKKCTFTWYIANFTESNLQICGYAQKRRICRENCKYALDENFHGLFCPRRKAAKFCHPVSQDLLYGKTLEEVQVALVSCNYFSFWYWTSERKLMKISLYLRDIDCLLDLSFD